MEVTVDKLKAASKLAFLWRKMYNNLCRSCKRKMFLIGGNVRKDGTQAVVDGIDQFLKEGLCPGCRIKIDKIMEENKK